MNIEYFRFVEIFYSRNMINTTWSTICAREYQTPITASPISPARIGQDDRTMSDLLKAGLLWSVAINCIIHTFGLGRDHWSYTNIRNMGICSRVIVSPGLVDLSSKQPQSFVQHRELGQRRMKPMGTTSCIDWYHGIWYFLNGWLPPFL